MSKHPNFIVIHADQLRYDCVGSAGRRTGIYTPNIDSIGWQGAVMDSCYSTCPVCMPQRMSLLTGQLPVTHGLFTNVGVPYLPLDTTLPAEFRRGGYQTALVGRNMHTYPTTHPYGFEYYLPGDTSSELKATSDAFFKYVRDNNPDDTGGFYGCGASNNSRVGTPFHLADHFHQTKWVVNRALDFLENRDKVRPYLLFVGFCAPHSPHNPPAEYFNRYYYRDDLDEPYIGDWEVPPRHNGSVTSSYVNLTGEELRVARAGYYGSIAFMDSQIGRLLGGPIGKNTYVLFTSDHGDLMGDHYMYQKSRAYEGSAHIPMHFMGPGIRDGMRLDAPVGWHDIMPTLLDFAGLPRPDSVDGKSMAGLLQGEQMKSEESQNSGSSTWRSYIHGECLHENKISEDRGMESTKINLFFEKGSQFLTNGRRKYIWHTTTGTEQFFNLETDWKEQHNLAGLHEYEKEVSWWRGELVQILKNRPEGFSDGIHLIAGREPRKVGERVEQVCRLRKSQGFQLAYTAAPNPLDNLDYEDPHMS